MQFPLFFLFSAVILHVWKQDLALVYWEFYGVFKQTISEHIFM